MNNVAEGYAIEKPRFRRVWVQSRGVWMWDVSDCMGGCTAPTVMAAWLGFQGFGNASELPMSLQYRGPE